MCNGDAPIRATNHSFTHSKLLNRTLADTNTSQRQHMQRTSWVVGPPMLMEVATSAWLALYPPSPQLQSYTLGGLVLLGVVWGSTALFLVPCHNRLLAGFDADAIRSLCRANWIRTIAWSGRGVIAIGLMAAPLN